MNDNDNETILKKILQEIVDEEFAEFDDTEKYPPFTPSLRHRLAMKRIFGKYERNVRKLKKKEAAEKREKNEYIPYYSLKQRIVIALVIVVLMTLLTGWYIPIRSITRAQIDWLRSKYDFPNMKVWVRESYGVNVCYSSSGKIISGAWSQPAEYRNFLDDLVELGIYSEKEMLNIEFQSEPIDTRSAPEGYELKFVEVELPDMEVTPLESYREHVLDVENRIESYRNRAKDPEKAWEGDEEFAQHIEEDYLPLPKSFLNLLEKLYAEIPDDKDDRKNFLSELDKDSRIYLAEIHKI